MATRIRPVRTPAEQCKLSFICQANWDELAATPNDNVRHCSQCERDVFRVYNKSERDVASAFNRCVAIGGFDGYDLRAGRPPKVDGSDLDTEDSFPPRVHVEALLSVPLDAVREAQLERDFPVFFRDAATTQAFLHGEAVRLGSLEVALVDALLADLAVRAPEVTVRFISPKPA